MKINKVQRFLQHLTIIFMSVAFSSFTLWLLDSWIKYPLFIFETFTLIILYLLFNNYDLKFKIRLPIEILNLFKCLVADVLLIIFSFILLIFNLLTLNGGAIQLVLTLLCTSFLPGYALLNVLELDSYFTLLESIIMSFILSYALTDFIALITLFLTPSMRTSIILSAFIMLGLISVIRHRQRRYSVVSSTRSLVRNIDFLAILIVIIFYVFSFYLLYPGFTLLVSDPVIHYVNSVILNRVPSAYTGWDYIFSNLHESVIIALSNTTILNEQVGVLTFNFLLPIAFYSMARRLFGEEHPKLPSIATLFWVLFTNSLGGFSWVYFTKLKLSSANLSQLQILEITDDKTWHGIHYAIFGLWYVPVNIALLTIIVAFSLIVRRDIPKSKYLLLFSTLVLISYLSHPLEITFFILFIAICNMLFANKYRLQDSLLASLVGYLIVGILYSFLPYIFPRFNLSLLSIIGVTVPVLLIISSLLLSKTMRKISFKWLRGKCTFLTIFAYALIFIYMLSLFSWTSLSDSFSTSQVDEIGLVPWFIYPVILGINGLLSIIIMPYLINSYKRSNFIIFILFLLLSLLTGKFLSFLNTFYATPYRENRFIWFMKIPLALLAPVPVIWFIEKARNKNNGIKKMAVSAVIGIIVLSGISTSFLSLERWNTVVNDPRNIPSNEEMSALESLRNIFDSDPKSFLITPTSSARVMLSAPSALLGRSDLLYTAKTPEFSLYLLSFNPKFSHPYLYLSDRDVIFLQNYYLNGYLAKQLIPIIPTVFENHEVKIYNVSKVSSPNLYSEAALLIPFDQSLGDYSLAYQILSQALYNYTTYYEQDSKALNHKVVILPFDPPPNNIIEYDFKDQFEEPNNLKNWTIVSGSWKIENGTLEGGKPVTDDLGIILSNVFAQNFTAYFKVKPMNYSSNVANYISLVYSFKDKSHFRSAELFFNPSGYIVAYFRIVDGTSWAYGYTIPENSWSTTTGIKWQPGDYYEVRVVVDGNSNEMFINGKKVLSVNIDSKDGLIGLMYSRFYMVQFDDFHIKGYAKLNLREKEEYMHFISSGGNLVVLNTNGLGAFSRMVFANYSTTNIMADFISNMSYTIKLPINIFVPKLTSNATVLTWFLNDNRETSPFVVLQAIGKGKIFYINVFPIITTINQNMSLASKLYPRLGELLSLSNLPIARSDEVSSSFNPEGYCAEIKLQNETIVHSTSVVFPAFKASTLEVFLENNQQKMFSNVTELSLSEYLSVEMRSSNITVIDGKGLYTTLLIKDRLSLFPHGNNSFVLLRSNGNYFFFKGAKELRIMPNKEIVTYSRNPTSFTSSNVLFRKLSISGYSPNYNIIRASGQDFIIHGRASFTILLSDTFNAIADLSFSGSIIRDPPILVFNELSALPIAVFWTLLFLPVFVALIFFFKAKELVYEKK